MEPEFEKNIAKLCKSYKELCFTPESEVMWLNVYFIAPILHKVFTHRDRYLTSLSMDELVHEVVWALDDIIDGRYEMQIQAEGNLIAFSLDDRSTCHHDWIINVLLNDIYYFDFENLMDG